MSDKRGITLIALILTIVLVLILAGVSFNINSNLVEKMNIQKVYTQLDILEAGVGVLYEEYKSKTTDIDSEGYTHYTKEEIEQQLGIQGIEQEAWINWNTRKAKMEYNGQFYESQGYQVEYDETEIKNDLAFDIYFEWQDNRYKIQIIPNNNIEGLRVAYRKKGETNWILVDKFEFEFVEAGDYEFRLSDKSGNENIQEKSIIYEENIE